MIHRAAFLLLALGFGLSGAAHAQTPAAPPATAPASALADAGNDKGMLVIDVKFAKDGTVAGCLIARSNVPYVLESGTVDYVRRKWVNAFFAGNRVRFHIVFDELPWYAKQWDYGLTPPPNFLPPGDPGRKMKLRVTFGSDGWLTKVEVKESSGLPEVDHTTSYWVKVHWHDTAYQGQTLDAPFIFKMPTVPAAPVVKAPPKPKAKAKPVVPVEDAAPPAVRVE